MRASKTPPHVRGLLRLFVFASIAVCLNAWAAPLELFFTPSTVKLKADFKDQLQERDRKRLKSGLLNRLLVNWKLINRSGKVAAQNSMVRLMQYDLWGERFIIKTITPAGELIEKPGAKGLDPLPLFTQFNDIPLAATPTLGGDTEYKLEVSLMVNPLTEKQQEEARRQVARSNFSGISSSGITSAKDEKKPANVSFSFIQNVIAQIIPMDEDAIVLTTPWVKP